MRPFRSLVLLALGAVGAAAAVAELRADELGEDPKMAELVQRVVPSPTKLSFVCATVCPPTLAADALKGLDLFEVVCPGRDASQGSYEKLCGAGLRDDPSVAALDGTGEVCRDGSCMPRGDYEMCRCDFEGCKRQVLTCGESGCTAKGAETAVGACACNDETQLACSGADVECLVEVERRLDSSGSSAPGQCSAHVSSMREDRTRTTVQCAYGMRRCKKTLEGAPPSLAPDAGTPVAREP